MARMRNGDMPDLATTAKAPSIISTPHIVLIPAPWPMVYPFPPPPPHTAPSSVRPVAPPHLPPPSSAAPVVPYPPPPHPWLGGVQVIENDTAETINASDDDDDDDGDDDGDDDNEEPHAPPAGAAAVGAAAGTPQGVAAPGTPALALEGAAAAVGIQEL